MLRNSHLFQLIYTSGKHLVETFQPEEVPYYMYEHNYSAITLENTEKVEKLFTAMASQSKAAGAKFMVVMLPERLQVYPKYRPERPLDYDKPQRLFRDFFARTGIAYLDLLPIMRNVAQSSQEPIYYERDSHFTRHGNEIAGNAIAEFLHDSGLVER